MGIRVNVTDYLGSPADPGTSYSNITRTLATNPDTGSAWTEADVEGVGSNPIVHMDHRMSSVTAEVRCTQCSIEVDYTAAGGAATHPGWMWSRGGWF